MNSQLEQNITGKLIDKLAKVAGVEVKPDRMEALTIRYLKFLQEIERLREFDIGDQEPATVFEARESEP